MNSNESLRQKEAEGILRHVSTNGMLPKTVDLAVLGPLTFSPKINGREVTRRERVNTHALFISERLLGPLEERSPEKAREMRVLLEKKYAHLKGLI